jgi:hypothetical protein
VKPFNNFQNRFFLEVNKLHRFVAILDCHGKEASPFTIMNNNSKIIIVIIKQNSERHYVYHSR